jgi:hypothetical protein
VLNTVPIEKGTETRRFVLLGSDKAGREDAERKEIELLKTP